MANIDEFLSGNYTQVPPTTDPFAHYFGSVLSYAVPKLRPSTCIVLGGFFIFHLFIQGFSLLVLFFSYSRQKQHSISNYQSYFQRLYIRDARGRNVEKSLVNSTPLYILNSGLVLAICQLVESALCQIHIGLSLRTILSPHYAAHVQLTPWMFTVYLFEFYACWTIAWTSLSIKLSSQPSYANHLRTGRFLVFTPKVLNTFFIAFPVLVTVLHSLTVCWIVDARKTEMGLLFKLQTIAKIGSEMWSKYNLHGLNSVTPDQNILQAHGLIAIAGQGTVAVQELHKSVLGLVHRVRLTYLNWTITLLITFSVYVGTVLHLLRAFRHTEPKRTKTLSQGSNMTVFGEKCGPEVPSEPPFCGTQWASTPRSSRLHKSSSHLILRSISMTLSLTYTITNAIIVLVKTHKFSTSPTWISVGMWMGLVSGALSAIPVTLQLWRLYQDKNLMFQVNQNINEKFSFCVESPGQVQPSKQTDFSAPLFPNRVQSPVSASSELWLSIYSRNL